MIVVSDTSPLTALITIGEEEILPCLFSQVVIPSGVRDELLRGHAVLAGPQPLCSRLPVRDLPPPRIGESPLTPVLRPKPRPA
jgi:predicted nucleic acid-binding protein